MANYTPTFTKPYPSGWVDKPSKTTPATAAIMNSYDTAIAALEAYLRDNAIDTVSVSVEQFPSDGRQWLGTITVGSDQYRIYMPSLKYENSVSDGVKIGTITLGEQSFDVYAPTSSAGGSTVSVVPKTLTGTNIAEITVDGTTYQLYAPTSGGSGSTVTAESTLTEGTRIGKITIDGTETILYAPTASPITVDAELSATSENAIQNKAVDAAVKNLQQQIDAGGTGGSITVDSALSTTSENPVQNKVVTAELNKKIETLEDESQAPDVVNFDLDSELSLTSVKGVQNKAIAEEFQKYANGTKVVAKATEADTATKASNAEKVNGHTVGTDVPINAVFTDTVYDDSTVKESIQNIVNGTTQVGNATKATQDAKGNVIDTTYAKKTEVPQGTVIDDALSSTSTNPVQNKVVKAEFDKVNSNLDDYEQRGFLSRNIAKYDISLYKGKTAGVDATVNSDGTISFSGTAFSNSFLFNDLDLTGKGIRKVAFNCTNKLHFIVVYMDETSSGYKNGDTVFEIPSDKEAKATRFYIEKGTNTSGIVAKPMFVSIGNTEFTPYIAQSTAQLNESLSVIGKCKNLLNSTFDTYTSNGVTFTRNDDETYTLSGSRTDTSNASYVSIIENLPLEIGKYKITGALNENNYIRCIIKVPDSANKNIYDHGKGVFLDVSEANTTITLLIVSTDDTSQTRIVKPMLTTNLNATYDDFVPYTGYGDTLTHDVAKIKNDLSNLKDGTTPAAKAVADEDGNNIKSTYAKKTEAFETVTEDVNVVLNSDLFDSTYSDITCVRIGKLCVLSFTIRVKNTISSTIDEIVLMTIVGTKYRPKKPYVNRPRQTFQGFAVGNYDENGTQSQSLNNTVRIITSSANNYTEIITRDKDRINWSGYVQGQIMWVTD